jgi:UDP-galactopyranose mutase
MAQIPLPWLAGKLPMPKRNEIFINNILRNKEKDMVHKQFFYPLKGGSAFFIDKLINNIDIKYNCEVTEITTQKDGKLTINNRTYDSIIYTGDIRNLNKIIPTTEMDNGDIQNLKSNGTTTVLCQSEPSNLSWLYIPELKYKAHRIIYTGNFSPANNGNRTLTCTVEFSGKMNLDEINRELSLLPGNLLPIAFNYEPNSYVVQNFNTRDIIQSAKDKLNNQNIYLLGRFAEWEYYNMDKAIEAAMVLINSKY